MRQERRQPVRPVRVEHAVGAALRDGPEVGGGNGQEVEHVAHRGAVEVAVAGDLARLEHHRVVDGCGQLSLGDGAGMGHGVAHRTRDLGRTAQRVRVLHATVSLTVRGDDSGPGERLEHAGGTQRLPRMRSQRLVQLRAEDLVGAQQSLHAHRSDEVGAVAEHVEVGEREDQHPEHAVSAVDEGQPLLLLQLDGLDARLCEKLGHRALHSIAVGGPALPHEHEGAVRERREVAAAAQASVLVHDRRDAGVEQRRHRLSGDGARAGAARAQRLEPEQHERAHDLTLDERAPASGVRPDERALKLGALVVRDVLGGQRAEARGDAVHGLGLRRQRLDHGARAVHRRERVGREDDLRVAASHGHHIVGRHAVGVDLDAVAAHAESLREWPPTHTRPMRSTPGR